jgi:Pyrimidine dimer DNA glycosylase
MNIFYLDRDPEQAAQYHCDKHVVKMILESAQLLSTAHRVLDGVPVQGKSATGRNVKRWRLDNEFDSVYYSASHVNHPSAVWVRTSRQHYSWLHDLFNCLLNEYTFRYGKIHKCEELLKPLWWIPHNLSNAPFEEPPQCMPDDCKDVFSSVIAYRNYYKIHKASFAKWSVRPTPFWWDEKILKAA